MSIMLGNLSVEQMEQRLGFCFPVEVRATMAVTNQQSASNIKKGLWHCFDIPFHIVCGDRETAQKIYDSVKDKAGEAKEPLAFSVSNYLK